MQIVLATDFSDAAAEALRTAVLIADAFGAELSVVHAGDVAHPLALRHVEARLQRLIDAHAPGRDVRGIAAAGRPVEALLAAADDVAADLIVIGAHVRQGQPLHLGDFAEELLHASPRPLLFAPRRMRAIRTIVCGVDCSEDARWTAHSAVEWGERFHAQVSVVNVIEPDAPDGHVVGELEAWLPPELRGRCQTRELVLGGGAAGRLIGYASTLKADLIVAGAGQIDGVVRRARCAVLAMLEAPSFAALAVV